MENIAIKQSLDHISICICTYKRPELLSRLLKSISGLETREKFAYSVVIVDNDSEKTGQKIFEDCKRSLNFKMSYFNEKTKNISLARNKSVKNSSGNLIAFIDDDEFPDKNWLINLYDALVDSGADGILGPVLPHFQNTPPKWLLRGKICERKRFKTGTVLRNRSDTRTGNTLLKIDLFAENEPFDPAFGVTGGGDSEFFRKHIELGKEFVWCDEAIVYETVPLFRQNRMYYIKRSFTRGMIAAKTIPLVSTPTIKSITAVIIYTFILPFLLVFNHGLFMKILIKDCDHFSKLLSYFGFNLVKERPYQ